MDQDWFFASFQMPVRVLPTMQDTDDLNVSGSHAVKQDVALQGDGGTEGCAYCAGFRACAAPVAARREQPG